MQGFRGQRGPQASGPLAGEGSRGTLGSWLSLRECEVGPVQVPIGVASGPAEEWQMADFPSVPCRWPRPRVQEDLDTHTQEAESGQQRRDGQAGGEYGAAGACAARVTQPVFQALCL